MASTQINNISSDIDIGGSLTVNSFTDSYIPQYGIIMWNGAHTSVPSGWYLCDGSNGTPDLRNRFVIGKGATGQNNTLGQVGGAFNKTLSLDEMPSHNHTISTQAGLGNHAHSFNAGSTPFSYGWDDYGGDASFWTSISTYRNWFTNYTGINHGHGITCQAIGSGQSFQITPPYYTLAYIMKA